MHVLYLSEIINDFECVIVLIDMNLGVGVPIRNWYMFETLSIKYRYIFETIDRLSGAVITNSAKVLEIST